MAIIAEPNLMFLKLQKIKFHKNLNFDNSFCLNWVNPSQTGLLKFANFTETQNFKLSPPKLDLV